jgi:hypothetical protein
VPLVCVSFSVDQRVQTTETREGANSLLPIYFMEALLIIHAMMGFLFIGWWKVTGKQLDKDL